MLPDDLRPCRCWRHPLALILFSIVAVSCNAPDTKADDAPKRGIELARNDIALLEEMRFTDTSGKEQLVTPGIYHVAKYGEKDLRLTAVGAERVTLLRAGLTRHGGHISAPQATIVRPDNAPGKVVVLWDPAGETRYAMGSPADIRPRGDSTLDYYQNPLSLTVDEVQVLEQPQTLSTLAVTRPRLADTWYLDTTETIRWTGSGFQPASVTIALFTETGIYVKTLAENAPNALASPQRTAADIRLGADHYSWKVEAIPGRYMVCVSHSMATDLSDVFTIALPARSPSALISAGKAHSLAIRQSDDAAWGWGSTSYRPLGPVSGAQLTPLNLDVPDVRAVAGGSYFSLFLKNDGTVWAVGKNDQGQLAPPAGSGPSPYRSEIKRIDGLSNIIAISAGDVHSLALTLSGTVKTWGGSLPGMDTASTYSFLPVRIDVGGIATAISAGKSHSLALLSDGTVNAWGYNSWGQLGDGTRTNSGSPHKVHNLSNATGIAAGPDISLAVLADGTVWTWGGRYQYTTKVIHDEPVQVQGLPAIRAVAVGSTCLAIDAGGEVWSWQWNGTPSKVPGIGDVIAVSAGNSHSLALKADGSIWAWGQGGAGQLGNGSTTYSGTPVRVDGLN